MSVSTTIDSPFKAFARGYAKSYVAVGALADLHQEVAPGIDRPVGDGDDAIAGFQIR